MCCVWLRRFPRKGLECGRGCGGDEPSKPSSRDEFEFASKEVSARWKALPADDKKRWTAKAKELAALAPQGPTALAARPTLAGRLSDVVRTAVNTTLSAGGAVVKVKNLVRASAAKVLKSSTRGVIAHYFKAKRFTWMLLEIQFATMTRNCKGLVSGATQIHAFYTRIRQPLRLFDLREFATRLGRKTARVCCSRCFEGASNQPEESTFFAGCTRAI